MTERFNTLTVVLEKNIREDEADGLLNAIRMIRGVLSVEGNVADSESFMAESRARHDIGRKVMAVLYPRDDFS
jgi:hypothetical protein